MQQETTQHYYYTHHKRNARHRKTTQTTPNTTKSIVNKQANHQIQIKQAPRAKPKTKTQIITKQNKAIKQHQSHP